ncbi:hypothetical protein CYMTET_22118 [Cymbomonas tetramitiformis]|uniref:Digalactosyldiacylglycerol synthase n=1 Tax=Cymbomonas tetramitiformis TaxID=36881 RepID=A0AAE0G0R5_9CHLO|nr:hypothetical protein CYMTET_22118 [Cymbomonas tetramitiformis]
MDSVLSLNFQDAREPGSIRELPGRILRKANVDRYIQYLGQWSTKDASKINSILSIARAEVEKGKERFGKVMKFSGGPGKSDLAVNDKEIAIVTTAAPPWLTGSAINPALRAAYLAQKLPSGSHVTLIAPWLQSKEQTIVFPQGITVNSPDEHVQYIHDWLLHTTNGEIGPGILNNLEIRLYPGRYSHDKHSILPLGDLTDYVQKQARMVVLEEPEHLTWYHHGRAWKKMFPWVVGVAHTNYIEYARREPGGGVLAFLLERVNQICCKAYCDRVVKLSPAVQQLPRQSVCNINGVGAKFLRIGDQKAAASRPRRSAFKKGCYYLAKMQWGKGYTELLDLMAQDAIGGGGISVDAYGSGDDSVAIVAKAQEEKLSIQFNGHQEGQGRYEHTDTALQEYKVFLNPSISDVLATTTAEALAMGKFVVAPDHACNTFFQDFPNFLSYKDAEGFRAQVQKALHAEPAPLSPELRHRLTWEAATDRFLVEVTRGAPEQSRLLPGLQEEQGKPFESTRGHVDGLIANVHHAIATVPGARAVAGAGPVTWQNNVQNMQVKHDVRAFRRHH